MARSRDSQHLFQSRGYLQEARARTMDALVELDTIDFAEAERRENLDLLRRRLKHVLNEVRQTELIIKGMERDADS